MKIYVGIKEGLPLRVDLPGGLVRVELELIAGETINGNKSGN